jgi:hypothetical protein
LKTIWTEKKSSKIGVILQQLRSQGLLNNLFMVEAGVSDKNDIHIDVHTMVIANISRCIEKVDVKQE